MNNIELTTLGKVRKVNLDKMDFLYMEVSNDLATQQQAWPKFESKFPTLNRRKMYGLDYEYIKKYRLCSLVLSEDESNTYGLNKFEFEGGNYMRLRLKFDKPELYEKIGPAYDYLFKNYEQNIDWKKPTIEYYKSSNILDIMIPIKE